VREMVESESIALISNAARTYQISAEAIPVESPGSPGIQLIVPGFGESLLDATVPSARAARADAAEELAEESETGMGYDDEAEAEGEADDLVAGPGRDEPEAGQYDLLGVETR
jgi:hypothetical protein